MLIPATQNGFKSDQGGSVEFPPRRQAKKLKGKGKALALYIHSCKKCLERYGVQLTWEKYDQMCSMIRRLGKPRYKYPGQVTALGRQSNSRSLFILQLDGHHYTVVYNRLHNMITTFLPEGCTPYGWEEKDD